MKSRSQKGYTSAELMLVLALGAMVIGGVVVSFGTLIRNQPRVSSVVTLNIGTRLSAFYGIGGTTINVNTAPNYGAVAIAEKLREQFHSDIISATSVFCLLSRARCNCRQHLSPDNHPFRPNDRCGSGYPYPLSCTPSIEEPCLSGSIQRRPSVHGTQAKRHRLCSGLQQICKPAHCHSHL